MFLYEYLVFCEVISQRTYVSFVNGKSQKLYNDVTSRLEELFQAASDDPKSTGSGGFFPTEKNKKYYKVYITTNFILKVLNQF